MAARTKTNTRTSYPSLAQVAPSKNMALVSRNTTFITAIGGNTQGGGDLGTSSSGRKGLTTLNARLNRGDTSQLVPIEGGYYLNPYVANQLQQMQAAAAADGISLKVISGYRDWEKQQALYDKFKRGQSGGLPAAAPGLSNHGLGFAIDLDVNSDSRTLQWLNNNASRYNFSGLANDRPHWEIRPERVPTEYLPTNSTFPKATLPSQPVPGSLNNTVETAIKYNKTKTSPDPITEQTKFYSSLNTSLKDLNNDETFFWFKQYYSSPTEIKSQIELFLTPDGEGDLFNFDNMFAFPSDSFGTLTNTAYTDSVSPVFDIPNNYGAPDPVPPILEMKLSPDTNIFNLSFSNDTTSLFKANTYNLQKVSDDQQDNLIADPTVPHSANLITDIPYYSHNIFSQTTYTTEAIDYVPETAAYSGYFTNLNQTPGYNPRDTENSNLQRIEDIYYEINVEGQIQLVDLLQKKYRESISTRTIQAFLSVKDCGNDQTSNGVTTDQINERFLNQVRQYNITRTPISLTEAANTKINSALGAVAAPNIALAKLDNLIQQTGISDIPGLQEISAPLISGITSPLQGLAGSISSIQNILLSPINNLPNALPSIDPGSFPEIYALLAGTDFKNVNASSIFDSIQQLKNIVCNFRLPIIGKVDFLDLLDNDIDYNLEQLKKKLLAILPKRPTDGDIAKFFEGLIPDFKQLWKSFYKTFFECENNTDN
jgi:hypothetical protein